jgi:hypothetical protein
MLYGDPGQMGNWSSRNRVEAFRSRCPIKMSRGGTPQAIGSESSVERHLASPLDDGQGISFWISMQIGGNAWTGRHTSLPDDTRGVQSDPEVDWQIGELKKRRGNADCDFQPCRGQKRTESGLSER